MRPQTMPAVSIGRNACDGSRMANVFHAKATEKLTDISVLTTTPGTTVSYQVYLLPDNFSSPEDGLLIEEDSESYAYGGYHLIALKKPTVLAKNQKYSVIVTETAPDSGDYVCFSAGFDSGTEELVPVVNPKESFYYRGGTWKDLSEGATLDEVSYGGPIDNFPIKAHLKAPQTVTVPKTSFTKTAVSAAFGLGAKTNGDGVLEYSSGNTKAATVSAGGKVMPKAPGTAKITIYAAAGRNYKKSAVKTVTVKVNKAANTLKVKSRTAAVEYKKVKKKAQSLKVSKVIKVTRKGQGKLSYAKASGNKKITIHKKTGKVTVKKGLKRGTYKVKVKVTASGNAKYKKATKKVTFKIMVK